MSLEDLEPETESSSSSGSSTTARSNGTGGDSDSDEWPKYRVSYPECVIKETDNGHESVRYPETTGLEMKKEWYAAPWEPADHLPGNWVRVYWSKSELEHAAHLVERELDEDFYKLVRERPKEAVEAQVQAAKEAGEPNTNREVRYRECAVCGEELYVIKDDHKEINGRVVCDNHTVEMLAHHDLI